MKNSILLSFLIFSSVSFSFAQNSLPVVKANSKSAYIIEGEEDRYNWNLSSTNKLDIHTLTKSVKPKWVTLYTDVDSIRVKMKPNENFDFIVLLNGEDSCYTRFESPALKNFSKQRPVTQDTIPFILSAFNNTIFKAVLNNKDTLNLKFDSGTTGLLLTNDVIDNKIQWARNAKFDNNLQMANLSWDSLRIYPVELSGQGTDGRFGWDLFDGKVVEIDYDKSLFIVHSKLPKISEDYAKFEMEYKYTLFCIQTDLQVNDIRYESRFLFDSGYQSTIMLDTFLMKKQNYPEDLKEIKRVIMRNGQGKEIPIITVNNERINFGKHKLFNIPVQLMTGANPARFNTHILGNEVLKRFNTFLDFQNNIVYLKPNSLIDLPYQDAG